MITKGDAILSLRPGSTFNVLGGNVQWLDETQTQPTEEEIVQKIAELEYVEEVKDYQRLRKAEYDALNQFEMQYDDQINGTTTWVDAIQAIKDKYTKAEIDETELANRKSQALHDYQLEKYTKAQARLAQYQVALGREEQTEEVVIGKEIVSTDNEGNHTYNDIAETRIVVSYIEPLSATITQVDIDGNKTEVPNPEILADDAERAAAQAIIDATPQAVIDTYNSGE